MTSEQLRLLPTRSDDHAASLGRLQFAAGGVAELSKAIWSEVGKRVALEPAPEELDRIEFGGIARQEMKLDPTGGRPDVVAHQMATVRPGAIPEDEQQPAKLSQQRFEEIDDLLFGDRPFVQAKAVSRYLNRPLVARTRRIEGSLGF